MFTPHCNKNSSEKKQIRNQATTHKSTGTSFFRSMGFITLCGIVAALTIAALERYSSAAAGGGVSLNTLGTAVSENFNTLANTGTSSTVPTGWAFAESGTAANTTYATGTGSSNTGDTYSFGAAGNSERAFGQLRSGSVNTTLGVCYTNNTGSTISSLVISYRGEMWRAGITNRNAADRMDFQYSLNATSITDATATWIDVDALDVTSPVINTTAGALDGNLTFLTRNSTISGLNIANGVTFFIRWTDFDISSSDDGLAIDDFSITPNGAVSLPNLSINDVSMNEGNNGSTTFSFTVGLSAPAGAGGVTFDIATANNSATQPSDYTLKSLTTQTIPAGSQTYTFDVLVNGDTTPEINESFFVNVTNVTGANVLDGQGLGTIQNDDAAPNLTINDVSRNEGNSGTTTFSFTVNLSAPAGTGGVSFDIATADGTASQPSDYTQKSFTSQTIPAGSSTYTFDVLVNGDTTIEAAETFFVNVTNATNAIVVDGQGQGTILNDDFTPIHDIQGNGNVSPLSGTVTTQGIVTGIISNGFFLQSPEALYDADPNTSEGIFVFTGGAPPAAAMIGNLVQVVGTITEFIPAADPDSIPLTELTSPTVTQISTGNPLPAAVVLITADTPPGGTLHILEKYEGMRVQVSSLTIVAPTLGSVNETNATASTNGVLFGVINGIARPFREPGIEADNIPGNDVPSGTIPPIPRYDANTERIRVDTDAQIGATPIEAGAGATLSNVIGPLTYGFRTYTILPDAATTPMLAGNPSALAVHTPAANEYTIATYNLQRFFDNIDEPGIGDPVLTATAYSNRLNKASLAIRNFLLMPDILGVVEVENLTTLQTLATKINNDAVAAGQPNPNYVAYLTEGNDPGGIDVGFLVKGPSRVNVLSVTQVGKTDTYINPNTSLPETLNDRPPLVLKAEVIAATGVRAPVTVIVNHLRSLNGVDDPTDGRVRAKRRAQAEFLANYVQGLQMADPNEKIVLVGDFNAYQFNDGFVDLINTILGTPTPASNVVLASADLVNPNLLNLVNLLFTSNTDLRRQPYSYVFDGSAQVLDHILISQNLQSANSGFEYARLSADYPETFRNDPNRPERLSDHDAPVAYFTFPITANLLITKTDSPDPVLAGNNITYSITVTNNGPDTATNVVMSDTLPTGTTFVSMSGSASTVLSTPSVGATGTVTSTLASLPVGGMMTVTLVVKVDPTVASGTVINNTATVSSATNDNDTTNNRAMASTNVETSADLSVTKLDTPDPVIAGNNLTYIITLNNAGPSNAAAVTLADALPPATTFVSLSSPMGWNCTTPPAGSNGAISCTNPSLGLGNAVFTLTVNVGAGVANGTTLTNNAIASSTTNDSSPGNNLGQATTTVNASANLAITKTNNVTMVAAGSQITYTITASNAGPSNAPNVKVMDAMPASLSNVTWTCVGAVGGSCGSPGSGDINATVNLPAGGSVTYTVQGTLAANATGVLSNTAMVTPPGTVADPNNNNNTAEDRDTILNPANVSGTKTVSGSFTPGSTITYTITLTNNSNSQQLNNPGDEFTDVLPAGLTLVSASASSGVAATNIGTRIVTWNGAIPANGSVTITIRATINPLANGTVLSNQGQIAYDADGDGTNEAARVTDDPSIVGPANPTDFAVTVIPFRVQISDPLVCTGDSNTLTVHAEVTNPNNAAGTFNFQATLPPQLSGVANTCVITGGTCTVNAGDVIASGPIAANQTISIDYKVRVTPGTPPGTNLCVDSTVTLNARQVAGVQACTVLNCPAANQIVNAQVSDQKAGSVLVFPYYTSRLADRRDTLLTISNIGSQFANVHIFFMEGASCSPADMFLCLTPNASFSMKASEYTPEETGYVIAVAVNADGLPVQNNSLIGNAFVMDGDYVGNYGAESFAAHSRALAAVEGGTATLFFDGSSYDGVPSQLAAEIQSPVDAVGQRIVTAGLSGDLTRVVMRGAAQVGVGIAVNGSERPFGSFSAFLLGNCQSLATISISNPRVPNGMGQTIPTGQTGTIRFNVGGAVGLLMTPRTASYKGIRTLHKTALTTATLTMPVIRPVC